MELPHQTSDDVEVVEGGYRFRLYTMAVQREETKTIQSQAAELRWLIAKHDRSSSGAEPVASECIEKALKRGLPKGWIAIEGRESLSPRWGAQMIMRPNPEQGMRPVRRRKPKAEDLLDTPALADGTTPAAGRRLAGECDPRETRMADHEDRPTRH